MELCDSQRKGSHIRAPSDQHRPQQLAPGEKKTEDCNRGIDWSRERNDDSPESSEWTSPVDSRGLYEFLRDTEKERIEQVSKERTGHEGNYLHLIGIQPLNLRHDKEQRHRECLERNDDEGDHNSNEEAPAPERQACEGIAEKAIDYQPADDDRGRDDDRVHE